MILGKNLYILILFSQVITLDLSTVVSSLSGPKRPHDRVSVSQMKEDFSACLTNKVRSNFSLCDKHCPVMDKKKIINSEHGLSH